MAAGWRTVRVFISSTFRDMQAERDHLVRFVFPRLREALARRRMHFVDVDLRWGVTADQDALELCLDEIDRCRPRFVCLLGGRYGWVPPGQSRSITASEVVYGALDRLDTPGFRYFYFRDPAATSSVPAPHAADYGEPPESDAAAALAALKARVGSATGVAPASPGATTRAPLPVREYSCRWDPGAGRFVGLEALGALVYADIIASVDAEFGPPDAGARDEFAEEAAAMDAFAEARVERFVVGSRRPVLDALAAHADARDGSGWLVLAGEAGTGKSALLAWFWREVEARHRDAAPGAAPLVIAHFVGASAASASVRQILRRLCHEITAALGSDDPMPDDEEELRRAVAERLERLAANRRVLLIVDAVNQIEAGGGAPLRWLPDALPAGARLVCSTLPGPVLDALRARRTPPAEVPLDPVNPDDASAIIDGFLDRFRKSLDGTQRGALLAKADAGKPLYLLTALEELRTLGTYEEISARIASLPEDVRALFDWILARLEADPGFRDGGDRPIGASLVRRYAACLASGRVGMTEAELADLVAPAEADGPADALGNVAALQRLLRPYLMRRGELVDFFHGQLREAVEARYLADPEARRAIHRDVAGYFRRKADPANDQTWTVADARALAELPFHLTEGELWDDVYATLTDLGFLEAKCTHVDAVTTGTGEDARTVYNGVYALQEDYRRALDRMPPDAPP